MYSMLTIESMSCYGPHFYMCKLWVSEVAILFERQAMSQIQTYAS